MNANGNGCCGIAAQSAVNHCVIISVAAEIPPSLDRIVLELGANRLAVFRTIPNPRPRMNPIAIAQSGACEAIMNAQPTVMKKTGSKMPNAMISQRRHVGIGGLLRRWCWNCSFSFILSRRYQISPFAPALWRREVW